MQEMWLRSFCTKVYLDVFPEFPKSPLRLGRSSSVSPIRKVPFSKDLCSSEEKTLEWDYSVQGTLLPQLHASFPCKADFQWGLRGSTLCCVLCVVLHAADGRTFSEC